MKKNTSGQTIGAQLCSATDGSAFTGTVTVYVTGDAGTQAIGSVGAGVCTHEGNGYHTYAPSQAETNYDLVAFTFIGTGAIPSTIQVATVPAEGLASPTNITSATGIVLAAATHTGAVIPRVTLVDTTTTNTDMRGTDNAATAANLAIVAGYLDTEIAAILADTNELQTDWVNGGRLDLLLDAIMVQTNLITSGTILLSTPVGGDGSLLELIKDTDYLNANGRALQWSFDEITGITVAATGKFGIQSVDGTEVYVNSSGVVTEPTAGTFKVSFDIANTALSALTPGRYDWSVEVLEGTTKITVARNRQIKTRVDIVEKYT